MTCSSPPRPRPAGGSCRPRTAATRRGPPPPPPPPHRGGRRRRLGGGPPPPRGDGLGRALGALPGFYGGGLPAVGTVRLRKAGAVGGRAKPPASSARHRPIQPRLDD